MIRYERQTILPETGSESHLPLSRAGALRLIARTQKILPAEIFG